MRIAPRLKVRSRKTVLLILQGEHQLSLYEQMFRLCQDVHWVCVLPDPQALDAALVQRIYIVYGVQIFTDRATALTSFLGIDAVITTFSVPHRAHSAQIAYIALAYEMGIPVFELQHGLFQLGISYSESSAFVGSGIPGALTALDAPNLTDQRLVWGAARGQGEISIGYPPFSRDIFESPACRRPDRGSVLIASNLHWNILSPDDVNACWTAIIRLIKALPDIPFVIMPHPSEMAGAALKRSIERCQSMGLRNFTLRRPKDRSEFVSMIAQSKLAVSMISSVLLDFEMYGLPCVLLPCKPQGPLARSLQVAVMPPHSHALIKAVENGYYDRTDLVLRTGLLRPFDPSALSAAVSQATLGARMSAAQAIPLMSKYLGRG